MDDLERDDIERSRMTSPDVKLAQALEMMAAGLRLHRARLERNHPGASAEEIERLLTEWLQGDD